jgi:hypothetical protein
MDKCKILEFAIKQNQTLVEFSDIWTGLIPKYFLVMFCKTSGISGTYSENPFLLPHNNVQSVYSKINGNMIPSYPYETDFSARPAKCLDAYASLYDEIGINRAAKEHYVSLAQFKEGAFILPFATCADGCFGRNAHPEQNGTISLHMKFKEGMTDAYTLLVFCCWSDYFEVDAARKVILSTGRAIP